MKNIGIKGPCCLVGEGAEEDRIKEERIEERFADKERRRRNLFADLYLVTIIRA